MKKNELFEILAIQTATRKQFRMFSYLVRQIKKIPDCSFYCDNGNLYVVKGNANRYPAIVAHMDTVHPIVENLSILKVGNLLTGFNCVSMEQTGIGGDDKVGVYIAMQCLKMFKIIKVAFFRDEESGCNGSALADIDFFANCNFILQCDRMYNNDFVIEGAGIPLSSQKFQRTIWGAVKGKKYRFTKGSLTDVVMLKSLGVSCSVANISCGYYRPHTNQEYVSIDDVNRCLQLVAILLSKFGNTSFPHEFKPKCSQKLATNYDDICCNCLSEPSQKNGLCRECNVFYNARWNAF